MNDYTILIHQKYKYHILKNINNESINIKCNWCTKENCIILEVSHIFFYKIIINSGYSLK